MSYLQLIIKPYDYRVIFNAGNKKYIILNTYLDKLWAFRVALNYSLKLDNFYLINKELIDNGVIADELGKEYLYNFLELSKYDN